MIRSESDVKARVKEILTKHGWFWWMPPANGFGRAGVADFHALKNGKFLAIETKFGKNKTTVLQNKFLKSIEDAGGHTMIVNEDALEALDHYLTYFNP